MLFNNIVKCWWAINEHKWISELFFCIMQIKIAPTFYALFICKTIVWIKLSLQRKNKLLTLVNSALKWLMFFIIYTLEIPAQNTFFVKKKCDRKLFPCIQNLLNALILLVTASNANILLIIIIVNTWSSHYKVTCDSLPIHYHKSCSCFDNFYISCYTITLANIGNFCSRRFECVTQFFLWLKNGKYSRWFYFKASWQQRANVGVLAGQLEEVKIILYIVQW